jgi:hypothetical protein
MRRILGFLPVILPAVSILLPFLTSAQPGVWTYHNDNSRSGANTNETILTPANVNTNSFGLLFTESVDGYVYTQPLYIPNVTISGKGAHNVVFVGTENNTVYAFDADSNTGSNSTPLWSTNLLGVGEVVLTTNDVNTTDITPKIGITGTPVIDTNAGTLFVVAKSRLISGGMTNYIQRLHALDITSGHERPNGPVIIECSVPGTGAGNDGLGHVPFNPQRENQRPGLLLLNGVVYVGFASHGDNDPYHGWLLGYDENTLEQVKVYNSNPDGSRDGIWQAGCAPAADTNGNIFFMTGNGTFDGNTNADYGDSFVKLSSTNAGTNLVLADYFTPFNQLTLSQNDTDLGSGGTMLLPDSVGSLAHPHLAIGAGKQGTVYLVDRDNMGHYNPANNSQIVQSLVNGVVECLSTPAFFNNSVYYLAYKDYLKAFPIANAFLNTVPISQTIVQSGVYGATPSISANGANNAIAWALFVNAFNTGGPPVLHAYDAYNLTVELYNSSQAGTRDAPGGAVKFTVPTVANGKVYVGTQSTLGVYGNGIFSSKPIIESFPSSRSFPAGANVTLSAGIFSSNAFTSQWLFNGAAIPGATTTNYSIPNIQTANAGAYSIVVGNGQGSITSAPAFITVVAPLTNYSGAILGPPGMVNWWPAEGNAVDIFGGNNGILEYGTTFTNGESGRAFHFDGSTAFINVGVSNLLPPWTACMWVNRQPALGAAAAIMADNNFAFKLEQYNRTNEVGITQLNGSDYVFTPTYVVPTNTWTHLAFVGSTIDVSLYVNGAFQGRVAYTNFPLPRAYIGAGFTTGSSSTFIDYMHGSLDEIMLFKVQLTPAQISSIYSAGSAGLWRAPQFVGINEGNGLVPLSLKGQTGKTFTIYTSSNLTNWQPLVTLPGSTGAVQYTNSVSNLIQFYRATQP